MLDYILNPPTLGVVMVAITVLGYISNWLNSRFLNFGLVRLLYYLGAFVHETSHALVAVFTGAKINEYTVLSQQPRVVYQNSRVPIFGNLLISIAPIFGGLVFLFVVSKYFLGGSFSIPQFSGWQNVPQMVWEVIRQVNLLNWQGWVFLMLCLNIGAMLGPSVQDLKNIWPALLILLFLKWSIVVDLTLFALVLIAANIAVQVVLVILFSFIKRK